MQPTLELVAKRQWGRIDFAPKNTVAQLLCKLLERKSLNVTQVKLCKEAGWNITFKSEEPTPEEFNEPASTA